MSILYGGGWRGSDEGHSSLQWLHSNRPVLQEIDVLPIGPEDLEVDIGGVCILQERQDTAFTNTFVMSF